jgi:MoxR-like ATPase
LFEEGEFNIPELARLNGKDSVKVYGHGTQDKLNVPSDGTIRCEHFPLVIMTSNGEREFPPAFLRRCLRLKMAQPNEEKLLEIAKLHLGPKVGTGENSKVIAEFLRLRDTEKREIATDQLLNALYLVTQGIELLSDDKSKLQQAIFAALTES